MIIQQQMIKAVETKEVGYRNYKTVDFYTLSNGNNGYNDSFLSHNGLTFEDYVGSLYLTGNELLYYPELAKKMQEIKEYPILKRTYKVNENIKGVPFIEYFYRRIKESLSNFQADLAVASLSVNTLIQLYGLERKPPLIDCIECENVTDCYQRKKLVINGVIWYLEDGYGKYNPTKFINFYSLLGISHDFERIYLENAVLGTPFIALRILKTWKHKGQVTWYNLDTLKKVSKSDITKAK